ncbi:MAG TPA: MraY family glycosyltransferase [Anaerolineales bacterium]|nr:MraY family glycosyltransferase [Anaerolineales bacterium]
MNSLSSIFIFRNVLLALVITLLLGWISIPLARRFGLMDFPGSAPHKKHETATPLAGGVVLLLTLLLCEWYSGLLEHPFLNATFLSVLPVFFIGLWDDFRSLSPPVKLVGQIAAAILLIRQGIYIRVFESPEFFIYGSSQIFVWLDWFLTIVWLVGITNAFNLVDSMDGLAVGLGGLAAAFFMLVTIDAYQTNLAQHSALIIGVCIGLYLFNSPPAMLFLGDAGAQTLGFILGVLAIAYNPIEANQASSWIVPVLLLGVPIFDTCLVIYSRWRGKRPITRAGRDHTYHRLLSKGVASQRAVLLMHTGGLILGSLAVLILKQPPLFANTVFGLVCITGVWLIIKLEKGEEKV